MEMLMFGQLCKQLHIAAWCETVSIDTWIRDGSVRAAVRHR